MREVAGTEGTWVDEYRDIVDFFYWEPQHLGRKKDPLSPISSAEAAWSRVAGIEVATNHILNFYVAMASLDVINVDEIWAPLDTYRLVGSAHLDALMQSLGGFTQADLLMRGDAHDCAIELKTKSKASVAQVRKYATLQALTSPAKPLTLVLLTPHREPANAFAERPGDLGAVMDALRAEPPTASVASRVESGAYEQVLAGLDLRLRTYDDLFTSVETALLTEASPIARRVHEGMLSWLTARGLSGRAQVLS